MAIAGGVRGTAPVPVAEDLGPIIDAVIGRFESPDNGYVQSEIDLVMQKIAIIVAISQSTQEERGRAMCLWSRAYTTR